MDYGKKYNDALTLAKCYYGKGQNEFLDTIFPELAESEDEMVIKIIKRQMCYDPDPVSDEERQLVETWLEKQKDHQNSSDAPNGSSEEGLISSPRKDKNLDEIAQDYVDNVREYNPEPTWDLVQTAVCYGYHYREQKEQKPAEWSEEDNKKLASAISPIADSQCFDHFRNISKEDVIAWLKSLPERFNLQPKQEWSEEDEIKRDSIIEYINSGNIYATSKVNMISWLKYLHPQPKAEWSEEDKKQIRQIERIVESSGCTKQLQERIHNWFKSRYPQPHWKPSEEQMEALESAVKLYKDTHFKIHHEKIVSLYEQLKKLM